MILSLGAAVAAAVFFGVAAALQARGAHAVPAGSATGVDPRVLVRVWRQWPFLVGLVLDLFGFVAQLVALRRLPLFAVQAGVAASLAVTAVTAALLLRMRVRGREWAAVAAVCAGLAALGLSAGAEGTPHTGWPFRWTLIAATAALALLGLAAARLFNTGHPEGARHHEGAGQPARPEGAGHHEGGGQPARSVRSGQRRAVVLGCAGGLGFGIVAVAARVLPGFWPGQLVRDPAAYLVLVAGGLAFAFYTTALHGGSVTAATAGMVVGETVMPAAVGVLALGDGTRPGFVPVAVGGFVLAVAGALALGRFGEVAPEPAPDPAPEPAANLPRT
jgi:drug/metabolite transporter (DMT)-like permease